MSQANRPVDIDAACIEISFVDILGNNRLCLSHLCGAGGFVAAKNFCVRNILAPQTAKALYADAFADMISEADPGVAPEAFDHLGWVFDVFYTFHGRQYIRCSTCCMCDIAQLR